MIGASHVGNSAHGRCGRSQQEIRAARVARIYALDVGVVAVEIHFSVRVGRLQGGELDMLKLEAHFERMLAVNLGEVVGDLEGGADLIRGQETIAAQTGQPID